MADQTDCQFHLTNALYAIVAYYCIIVKGDQIGLGYDSEG